MVEQSIARGAIQKPEELQQLVEFLQDRKKPRVVLEIGTAVGGTLWLWCQLAYPTATIVSVDLPNGPFGGGYRDEDIPKLLTYTTNQQWMQLFRGDSHSPEMLATVKRFFKNRHEKVDLLFIDGDHTYQGVMQDWLMYGPLVKPGGIVVFHDIVEHPAVPDCHVDRAWNEIKNDYAHEEFCFAGGGEWGGIGVIHIA